MIESTQRPEAGKAPIRARPNPQDEQPSYVLHSFAFRETSLVVEVFTRNHGRLGLIARGARRPRSALRGVLMPFQPLLVSWSGKSELRLLHRAEPQAGYVQLQGQALVCGFYVNELLVRLLAREDPHEGLYSSYEAALDALRSAGAPAVALRRFEKRLLADLGYGLSLEFDDTGHAVRAQEPYRYVLERGPAPVARAPGPQSAVVVRGKTLLDLACEDFSDPTTLLESRTLMRYVLNHHLGGQILHTRQLLADLQAARGDGPA